MVPKPHAKSAKKALRKKKVHLKFNVECKNPVEDGILRIEDLSIEFPSLSQDQA
uniref:Isoform b of Large ribosomal subunit protein eL22 n=1 Tax=Caenorhabditis elegans TaxID=6239 RepID=P52819-2